MGQETKTKKKSTPSLKFGITSKLQVRGGKYVGSSCCIIFFFIDSPLLTSHLQIAQELSLKFY